MFIYIDWTERKIYTENEKKDLINELATDSNDFTKFEDFLMDNYTCEEMFYFSPEKKSMVEREYEELIEEEFDEYVAEDDCISAYVINCGKTITIEKIGE